MNTYLQMVIRCWHVIGILQKLSYVSHNGLLIWVFNINICSADKYTESLYCCSVWQLLTSTVILSDVVLNDI